MKYRDSKGREHILGEMAYTYLKNARAKLDRENHDLHAAMILAMDAEIARRDASFAADEAHGKGRDGAP